MERSLLSGLTFSKQGSLPLCSQFPVPFLDLNAQHAPLRREIESAIHEVLDSSEFAGGRFVAKFEQEFADYCGSPYSVCVGSGTDALWLSLLALEIGPGDEVITVPNSFRATVEAICFAGARPVFVDVDDLTYTMDPDLLESAITPKTRAIIPVHLYGQMADMPRIMAIADSHGIPVVEDACQAHGAAFDSRTSGTIGALGCFSFYPSKNLGGIGESGAILTRNEGLFRRLQALREHGQTPDPRHACVGWNARMDGIQAAVLSVKLKRLEEWNMARCVLAHAYDGRLAGSESLVVPFKASNTRHVYHLYVVQVPERDRVRERMASLGVQCGVHYAEPIHRLEAYRWLGYPAGSFPIAERCARECLSLPMHPRLSLDQVDRVSDALHAVMVELQSAYDRVA